MTFTFSNALLSALAYDANESLFIFHFNAHVFGGPFVALAHVNLAWNEVAPENMFSVDTDDDSFHSPKW